jgi:hypothetical protein
MDRKGKENMQCVEIWHVGYVGCERKRTTAVSVGGTLYNPSIPGCSSSCAASETCCWCHQSQKFFLTSRTVGAMFT